jgi:hypothetical protein
VDPRTGLGDVEKRKISTYRNSNSESYTAMKLGAVPSAGKLISAQALRI